ncbi:MAG TPA: YbaK/EbsC family protein [Verrucomicrobiae bacterium]|nr:YbaK/EbsC family protein [Verrucomicrobiae bacterium]
MVIHLTLVYSGLWFSKEKGFVMAVAKLKEFLDREGVKYSAVSHLPAYTMQEVAESAHIPGKQLAKTVIVKLDGEMAMAVLPANQKVIMQDLRDMTGSENVKFASEAEFEKHFPDCEIGAMPPFGNLYGMEVFVAESLAGNEEIAFTAGSHREVIRMAYSDFDRLVQPKVLNFST